MGSTVTTRLTCGDRAESIYCSVPQGKGLMTTYWLTSRVDQTDTRADSGQTSPAMATKIAENAESSTDYKMQDVNQDTGLNGDPYGKTGIYINERGSPGKNNRKLSRPLTILLRHLHIRLALQKRQQALFKFRSARPIALRAMPIR